jgi:hypothetical protein
MNNYISDHGLFLTQFFFSLIGITFSMSMLILGKDPSIYLPIFSTIIGVWVPSPMSKQREYQPLENVVVHENQ